MNRRFFQKLKSSKPVIVDFYADWCRPCKDVSAVLKNVKKEVKGFRLLKVNVENNPLIVSHFKIRRLPTVLVFKNGEPVWSNEGELCPEELKKVLHQ